MTKRKWLFYLTIDYRDSVYVQKFYFIGTYEEACDCALQCADEWGHIGEITKLVIESHGRV